MTTNIVSQEKGKPVFDEQALAKLLESAYVLQEHNRKMQKPVPPHETPAPLPRRQERPIHAAPAAPEVSPQERASGRDYTFILAQIVDAQRQIQVDHLGLEDAMSKVASLLVEMTKAAGASIGIVEGQQIRYRTAIGHGALAVGTVMAAENTLSAECLRTGQVVRCANIDSESAFHAAECRQRGILSLIAVPVYHDTAVEGSLELYFPRPDGFTEQDVHTCQLMSGLVTEALTRDNELTWKKSLASERAAMLEALEKLKPNLAALRNTQALARESAAHAAAPAPKSAEPAAVCARCGHPLVADELFCGKCGSPRSADHEPATTMQSKVATLMNLPPSRKGAASARASAAVEMAPVDALQPEEPVWDEARGSDSPAAAALREHVPASADTSDASIADLEIEFQPEDDREQDASPETDTATTVPAASSLTPSSVKPVPAADWSSAAAAREFLEQLEPVKRPDALSRFWKARRGDIYLAVAVLLVAAAIRWGIWSDHSAGPAGTPAAAAAAAHRKAAPDADLSFFDRVLIKLGLAEAPEPVEYKGNPETQVWVDLHTALYYCPGADLYGKTPTGKFTSQRDAQLDQFEPAYRKACN
jgi:GAF domain-containing protein